MAEPMETDLKKRRGEATIGTHSGTFQCDEALGVWMLRQLPQWREAKLVRSRDLAVLQPLDIVIDVGGVYDPAALRFDHHQRGFSETFDTCKFKRTKLSATGLVYKHFGKDVLRAMYPRELADSRWLDAAYGKLYGDMIEGVDAVDNGIEIADVMRYREGTSLSSRVARLNPRWNEQNVDAADEDARFEDASAMTGGEFKEQLAAIVEGWLPARDLVEKALLQRQSVSPSTAQVVCFESGGMPWKGHLYELERLHGVMPLIKFVLYEDGSGMWRVQAVTVEGTAFTNRLSLPEAWRGLRDAALSAASGIVDCKFCHAGGFIGGHANREGALAMAHAAIKQGE